MQRDNKRKHRKKTKRPEKGEGKQVRINKEKKLTETKRRSLDQKGELGGEKGCGEDQKRIDIGRNDSYIGMGRGIEER